MRCIVFVLVCHCSRARTIRFDRGRERNAATLAWMREAFALAARDGIHGLMLFIQANPFPYTPNDPAVNGYEDVVVALEAETKTVGKPVVLAHGDSHYFRLDKPLP